MSIHFHPLKVKKVNRETDECVSVVFDIPEQLQPQFQYKQGQNLTLKTTINGKEVRRSYSLCSSPLEKEWKVAIKKVEGGSFSTYANTQLKAGDVLDVMEPTGRFYTELQASQSKNYMAFAAGSGITPLLSIIKTTLATEPGSRFTLVFGNRTRSSVIFFEELEAIKNKYMARFQLVHVLSREKTDTAISFGRIDATKLEALDKLVDYAGMDDFFICGPEEMIFTVKNFLENKGIEPRKIHFELFNAVVKRKTTDNRQEAPDGVQSKITIRSDGRSIDFTIPLNSDITLLDAALQQGADLPFACKGGMCCTCKAKLVEGEVQMDVHWGLEHDEVEQGFILTCQSHPKTEKVVVDFDAK